MRERKKKRREVGERKAWRGKEVEKENMERMK